MNTEGKDFEGKVVVITGASKGIGRATAEGFAGRGATLAICSRNQEEITKTALELSK